MDRIVTPLMALGALVGILMVGCGLEVALARHWSSVNGLPGIDLVATQSWTTEIQPTGLEHFQLVTCNSVDPNATTTDSTAQDLVSLPNPATGSMYLDEAASGDDSTIARQTQKVSVSPMTNATPPFRGNSHVSTRGRASSDKLFGMSNRTDAVKQFPRAPAPLAHTQARVKDRSRSPHDRIVLAERSSGSDLGESAA
jgi:hypothetical protein